MKKKNVIKALYTGETVNKAFITGCRILILSVLKKRGILTEKELEKGITILREQDS